MINASRLTLSGAIALLGCASRVAPAGHGGAASLDAPAAPTAVVTRALDSEPPVPGGDDSGWPGLRPTSDAPPAHEHAHMDHAQAAPTQPSAHDAHPQHPPAQQAPPRAHGGHGQHGDHAPPADRKVP